MKREYVFGGVIIGLLVIIALLLLRRDSSTHQTATESREKNSLSSNGSEDTLQMPSSLTDPQSPKEPANTGLTDVIRDGMELTKKLPIPGSDSLPTIKPTKVVSDIADSAQGVLKKADEAGQQIFNLSIEEEQTWGRRLHNELLQSQEVDHSEELQKRLNDLATPILEHRKRKKIGFTITILKDPDINAFSFVGG